MPVSEALRRLSEDPRFWSQLFVHDGAFPDPDPAELRVALPVTGGYGLVLDLDLPTGEQRLGLREPASTEPVQLGWAAPGRPYPAALRWHELELCARVIALEDPTLPHPGLVVALLSPFAPLTADDDESAAAAVRAAAYRSLRREVPPAVPAGPEQAPLPLFAAESWWPQPPAPSPRVIDETAVAAYTAPAPARLEVRGGSRFPREGLAELVRQAAERLSRLPGEQWYARVRPLARHIADTGDLRPVGDLLGELTEAGCDHPTVLDALSEPLVPLEACWMVETLAGALPGTLLRRHV
ncbi:hypothetical protein GCM10020358_73400 [Amorphoplanes nipponensis]|uniref:Uncharacterized protein n=1 Tax=Actinoplanes nipponensis TaxID=135950 RepID=A0A919JIC9_9ACTN|nr:hypothetical protein Ani05nite_32900 [Actinoplanes nipponensis]